MQSAKIFESGNSQAVRLPKAYRLDGKETYITKVGDALILIPKRSNWDSLIFSLDKFSEDFLSDRTQPPLEERIDIFK